MEILDLKSTILTFTREAPTWSKLELEEEQIDECEDGSIEIFKKWIQLQRNVGHNWRL